MTSQRAAFMLPRIRFNIDGDESYDAYPVPEAPTSPHPLEFTWSDGTGYLERLRIGTYGMSAVQSNDGGAVWALSNLSYYGLGHDFFVKSAGGPLRLAAHVGADSSYVVAFNGAGSAVGTLTINSNLTFNGKTVTVCLGGVTGQRPSNLTADNIGQHFWDTTLGKAVFWNGAAWKLADGTAA